MELYARTQSLFPLALMGLLAGLTFWLQQATEIRSRPSDSLLRHDPDYIVENLTLRRFDAGGDLQSVLMAEKMLHYPDDDTTVVSAPHLTFLKGPRPTSLTAREGLVGPQGGEVTLVGDVRVVRKGTATDPQIVFSTSHLTVFPDEETARTSAAVTIVQQASVIRGVGMEADNKTQVYRLLSQVSGTIEKRR